MKNRKKRTADIKINPQIIDDELLFYFTPKAIEFFKIDKTSTAYLFSCHFMSSILEQYKSHPGKIGLVGEDVETIKISLAMVLQGYDGYIHTAFLRDIIPHNLNCQTNFESRIPDISQGDE